MVTLAISFSTAIVIVEKGWRNGYQRPITKSAHLSWECNGNHVKIRKNWMNFGTIPCQWRKKPTKIHKHAPHIQSLLLGLILLDLNTKFTVLTSPPFLNLSSQATLSQFFYSSKSLPTPLHASSSSPLTAVSQIPGLLF